MLKKMRIRVIASAMLAFSAVIILIALLVNVVNYYDVTERVDQTLSYVLKFEESVPMKPDKEGPPPGPFMALPDLESNYMTRFFVVRFDSSDKSASTYTDYIVSIDEDEAVSFAKKALEKNSERGYIGDYRFVKKKVADTTVVVFLNVSRELQSIRSLRNLTIAVAGISLILVFILSQQKIRPDLIIPARNN